MRRAYAHGAPINKSAKRPDPYAGHRPHQAGLFAQLISAARGRPVLALAA